MGRRILSFTLYRLQQCNRPLASFEDKNLVEIATVAMRQRIFRRHGVVRARHQKTILDND